MNMENKKIYQKAFDLMNTECLPESIAEFKRIIEKEGDPSGICPIMIAMIYYYELNDCQSALPFAKQAV